MEHADVMHRFCVFRIRCRDVDASVCRHSDYTHCECKSKHVGTGKSLRAHVIQSMLYSQQVRQACYGTYLTVWNLLPVL